MWLMVICGLLMGLMRVSELVINVPVCGVSHEPDRAA
jgi:hypothetical protein